MKFSLIVAARQKNELPKFLNSIRQLDFPKNEFETILLPDGQAQFYFPDLDLRIFPFPENSHPSQKRNFGAAKAQGEIFVFFDDDTIIPPDWLLRLDKIMDKDSAFLAGGPNLEKRPEFKYKIAAAIQSSALSEGLDSHSKKTGKFQNVNHHNLPLCNLAVPRKIFEIIGGFNEIANYFMDDVEFCYIAKRRGYKLRLYPELEIQHNARPFFIPFFKYKLKTRFQVGKNFLLFPECYGQAKQIWAIGVSYLFIFCLPWIKNLPFFQPAAIGAVGLYAVALFFSARRLIKNPLALAATAIGIFFTHAVSWIGFSAGIAAGLFSFMFAFPKNARIIAHKKLRYGSKQ